MKRIEINTTQHVVIQYELASTFQRIAAFAIDFAVVSVAVSILSTLLVVLFHEMNMFIYFLLILPYFIYNLVSEIITNGQSIGKKALGIKVMKLNGDKLHAFDFLMRWVFRSVEILLSLGIIAIVMISSTARAQRLGDMFADLVVIRTRNNDLNNLNWVISRPKDPDYQPVYTGITMFTEDEMLTVKHTLNRYQRYKNQGHKEAVLLLVQKMEEQLQVTAPQNKIDFLNQLIKDYVYLTR